MRLVPEQRIVTVIVNIHLIISVLLSVSSGFFYCLSIYESDLELHLSTYYGHHCFLNVLLFFSD